MSEETFSSVWKAIEDTPAKAENMKLRSELMMALEEHIRRQGWTQVEAAQQLGGHAAAHAGSNARQN